MLKAELQSGRLSLSPIGFASQQVMDTLQLLATSPSKKHVDLMQEDDPMYIPEKPDRQMVLYRASYQLKHLASYQICWPVIPSVLQAFTLFFICTAAACL